MPKIIALTGATGFIGQHVVHRLLRAGLQVKILVRSPQKEENLKRFLGSLGLSSRILSVHGSLEDKEALKELLNGTEAVVHLAGAIRGADFEEFGHVNVKGFWRLLSFWQGKTPFLYVSSLAARHPYLSPYATSKRIGEEILRGQKGPWTIFRPPAVYGPGDRELLPLIRLMWQGVLLVFGKEDHRFSLLHVEDLAEAVLCWLQNPKTQRTYELHDGKIGGYSWRELSEIVTNLRKRPVKVVKVSRRALFSVSYLAVFWGQLLRKSPMLTPGKVNELFHYHWVCDNTLIEKDLGWKPRFNLEKGLRSLGLKV